MLLKSIRLYLYIIQSDLIKILTTTFNILPFALFLYFLSSFGLFDSSITFCMECKYVQNAVGDIVVHPKTGEPLQNCSRTEFVVRMDKLESVSISAMEKIESLTKYMLPSAELKINSSSANSNSSIVETTCDPTKVNTDK
jgi:hypothetical protein